MNKFYIVSKLEYNRAVENDNSLPKLHNFENFVPYSELKIPVRATQNSAGYDFYAPIAITIQPDEEVLIPTFVKCELEKDRVLMVYPRSGLGFKNFIRLANTTGIIDADYYNNESNEGNIYIKLRNEGRLPLHLNAGDRFAQGIIFRFDLAEEEEVKKLRKSGFGSTDEN